MSVNEKLNMCKFPIDIQIFNVIVNKHIVFIRKKKSIT
jgi:hypothetical protein